MVQIMAQLADFGPVSGMVSQAHGGLGIGWLTSTMLFEEVAAASAHLSVPVLINSFGPQILDRIAPMHLRDRYLPGLVSGKSFCSIGISEPDVGSTCWKSRRAPSAMAISTSSQARRPGSATECIRIS